MRKRRNIWVLGVAACALLATSCGTDEPNPDPTPTPESYKLTVNSDSGVESVKITADGTEVTDLTRIEEGTELTAVIDLKDDYEISAVTLNGDAVSVSATDGSYVFDMPSKDSTLAVTTSEVAPEVSTITVTNDDTKGTYTLTKGDTAVTDGKVNVGDTVTLTVTPNTGYTVASVTLDGTALTLTDGVYSFTASAATHAVVINYDEVKVNVSLTVYDEPSYDFYENAQLLSGDTDVTDGAEVRVGSELKVVLTASGDRGTFEETEYIKILGKIYLHVGDVVYHGDDENAVVSEDFLTLTFTIKAPEKDADIVLSYNSYRATEDDETAVTVTMAENENLEFYGYSATDKYVNQRFQVGIKRKPGYVITKATLTHSLWKIKVTDRSANGRVYTYVNKETGFELAFDHTNALQRVDGDSHGQVAPLPDFAVFFQQAGHVGLVDHHHVGNLPPAFRGHVGNDFAGYPEIFFALVVHLCRYFPFGTKLRQISREKKSTDPIAFTQNIINFPADNNENDLC